MLVLYYCIHWYSSTMLYIYYILIQCLYCTVNIYVIICSKLSYSRVVRGFGNSSQPRSRSSRTIKILLNHIHIYVLVFEVVCYFKYFQMTCCVWFLTLYAPPLLTVRHFVTLIMFGDMWILDSDLLQIIKLCEYWIVTCYRSLNYVNIG
jgi:hypothetical protein